MKVILAIDGGGSRTRCLAIDQQGQVCGRAESGPSNHLLVDSEVVKRSLTEAIEQMLRTSSLKSDQVLCVSAGMAGVDFDGAGAPPMEALLREVGFKKSVVNGDMVIAHAGALQLMPGVVALAGTGSVVLGIGRSGNRVKVGGWGPIYGDEGSAYRIGEMSLRAAAHAYDGRGPATALTDSLLKALGLNEFRDTVSRVYIDQIKPSEIAALSRVAYQVAEAGDGLARKIFFRAGEDLAEGVVAAIQRLGLDHHEVAVSYQGSVIESCRLLRERFIEQLNRQVPRCKVLAPRFEPVIGAYLLGRVALGWEISADVLDDLDRSLSTGTTS